MCFQWCMSLSIVHKWINNHNEIKTVKLSKLFLNWILTPRILIMKVNAPCHVNLMSSTETPSFFFVMDIRGFPPAETISKHTQRRLTCQTAEISLCGQVSRLSRLQAAFLLPLTQRVLHPSVYPTQPIHFRFIYCKLCFVTSMANFISRQLIFLFPITASVTATQRSFKRVNSSAYLQT